MAEASCEPSCDCGAVTMTVRGEPVASVYCHCPSCREFHDIDDDLPKSRSNELSNPLKS